MFRKPPPATTKNNNTTGSSNSTPYAFSQPSAANSSAAVRQSEKETFYQPLPAPRPNKTEANSSSSLPGTPPNPFRDREYDSRTPSPHASNPLLTHASPTTRDFNNMPTPSRNYASPRAAGMMQPRGESQSALLGNNGAPRRSSTTSHRRMSVLPGPGPIPPPKSSPLSPLGSPSNARRYGPTASSAPIGPNAALLGSPSQSVSDKHNTSDPTQWGAGLETMNPEADDYLHNPDPKRDRKNDRGGSIFTVRGVANIGCLFLLLLSLIALFAGYPIITFYTKTNLSSNGAYNLGGINSTGQIPLIANFPSPIDPETPKDVYTRTGFDDQQYNLVFSDEFNKDGRTFYPGDDPYWTAVDLHYWPTVDFEWYDPSAVTTRDGKMVITQSQENIHDLNFKSGMVQSWNQMCFQYSVYVEVSVSLPGTPDVGGFWPGVWMMGNLGRPGYGATTEGTWPYSYDSCDIGTLANQTTPDGSGPVAALTTGLNGGPISSLPGQRVSACTCKGEDHPGPDVSYGRSVPEIDIIEGQIDLSIPRGQVSQSAQIAPFDDNYQFNNASNAVSQYDTDLTKWNSYLGGSYQQAVSSLTYLNNDDYVGTSGGFGVYGFEFYSNPNDRASGHITWVANGQKSWTLLPLAIGPNSRTQIGQRLITEEPMAMILNFGASNGFQTVNFNSLQWPAEMLIDYVRVYQRTDGKMGCDPVDRPTADYIARHRNAYDNANLTTWKDAGYTFPKNSLIDQC